MVVVSRGLFGWRLEPPPRASLVLALTHPACDTLQQLSHLPLPAGNQGLLLDQAFQVAGENFLHLRLAASQCLLLAEQSLLGADHSLQGLRRELLQLLLAPLSAGGKKHRK